MTEISVEAAGKIRREMVADARRIVLRHVPRSLHQNLELFFHQELLELAVRPDVDA